MRSRRLFGSFAIRPGSPSVGVNPERHAEVGGGALHRLDHNSPGLFDQRLGRPSRSMLSWTGKSILTPSGSASLSRINASFIRSAAVP